MKEKSMSFSEVMFKRAVPFTFFVVVIFMILYNLYPSNQESDKLSVSYPEPLIDIYIDIAAPEIIYGNVVFTFDGGVIKNVPIFKLVRQERYISVLGDYRYSTKMPQYQFLGLDEALLNKTDHGIEGYIKIYEYSDNFTMTLYQEGHSETNKIYLRQYINFYSEFLKYDRTTKYYSNHNIVYNYDIEKKLADNIRAEIDMEVLYYG